MVIDIPKKPAIIGVTLPNRQSKVSFEPLRVKYTAKAFHVKTSSAMRPAYSFAFSGEHQHAADVRLITTTRGNRTMKPVWDAQIDRLAALSNDWDDDGSPAPTDIAVHAARNGLEVMDALGIDPDDILPMPDGGIGFTFISSVGSGSVEFLNSGSIIVALDYDDKPYLLPDVWKITAASELRDAFIKITEELGLNHKNTATLQPI